MASPSGGDCSQPVPDLHIAEMDPKPESEADLIQMLSHMDAKLQLKDHEIHEKDQKIHALEETIQSISGQYEDLLAVAEKYKEEAAKWHYLYLSSAGSFPNIP